MKIIGSNLNNFLLSTCVEDNLELRVLSFVFFLFFNSTILELNNLILFDTFNSVHKFNSIIVCKLVQIEMLSLLLYMSLIKWQTFNEIPFLES